MTEPEKEHIAKFNLIDAKLLRVKLKSIQTDNYNFLVEGVSTLYLFGLLAGTILGLANGLKQPIERQPLGLFGAVAVVTFGSLYFFASTEKFWTTFLGTSYGLINGLLLWPLLWLIEKITEDQDSKEASTQT